MPIDKEDWPASFSLKSQNLGSEIPEAVSLLQAVQVLWFDTEWMKKNQTSGLLARCYRVDR